MAERLSKKRLNKIEDEAEKRAKASADLMPKLTGWGTAGAVLPYKERQFAFEVIKGLVKIIKEEQDSLEVPTPSGAKFKFNID